MVTEELTIRLSKLCAVFYFEGVPTHRRAHRAMEHQSSRQKLGDRKMVEG